MLRLFVMCVCVAIISCADHDELVQEDGAGELTPTLTVLHSSLPETATPASCDEVLHDQDHDSVASSNDCDDYDATIYPGAYEWCDNKDNDCDGATDEVWYAVFPNHLGQACTTIGDNDCVSRGVWQCDMSHDWLACSAPPRDPSIEKCNGEDDNCDGQTDTDRWPYLGYPCKILTGGCEREGTWQCDPYSEDIYCTAEDLDCDP